MNVNWRVGLLGACLWGCTGDQTSEQTLDPPRGFESPVMTNADLAIEYPVELYEQRIEGTVLLHLFVNESGAILPESTRIAEPSGFAELDSAALNSVADFVFAPARRDGTPVATAFLQPIHFQHPDLLARGEN